MGFLIRAAFWFSLVLLLLPFNIGSDDPQHESVGPLQAFVAAREAVGDIAGICERKPDVCVVGKQALHTIAERAKATVRIAADMIGENDAPDQETITGTVPAPAADIPAEPPAELASN